mgnify:CR=1 FL=1
MAINYSYTNVFQKNDNFGCWHIKWENTTSSEGLTKVKAFISLDITIFLNLLISKRILDGNIANYIYLAKTYDEDNQEAMLNAIKQHFDSVHFNKQLRLYQDVEEFCKQKSRIESKWGYSFRDALWGGNESSFEKAVNKIKKSLILEGEDTLTKQFIDFFRKKGYEL